MIGAFKRWQAQRRERRRRQAVEELQREVGIRLNRAIDFHTQAASDGAQASEGQAHLDPMWVHFVATTQHLDATMCLVKMLIATHHDSQWLKRTWSLNASQMTDRLFDAPAPFGNEALKQVMLDAWKLSIQDYTRLIDEAVEAHRQDEDDA